MTAPAPNAYLKTKVLTASPAELRLMLFDGALKFAEQARQGLEREDFEAVYEGITRCQAIVLELINGLDPNQAPELTERLSGLYTFFYTRLMAASHERDPAIIDEVIRLLKYERETWVMLMDRLGGDGGQGVPNPPPDPNLPGPGQPDAPDPAEPAAAPPSGNTAKLIGGRVSFRG